MIPSRRYEPSYPPPRNTWHGQNIYQAPHQPQQQQSLQQQQQQHQQIPQHHQQQQQQSQQLQQQQNDGQQSQLGNQPNGGQSQPSLDGQSAAGASGGPGQEMNLASVLHYLQSEWRRWERDRNEWEIERAEMRARIALLEGQRRSAENLKVDLLRRVKMLEFALRQERTKVSGAGTISKAGGIAPSKLASLQEDDRSSNRSDKEGSDSGISGGSDERDDDRFKMNGNHAGTSKSSGSTKGSDFSPWKNIGSVPRDPKSRARSREYLKQCLQEITYLTSPRALNPIPNRPPITDLDQTSPKTGSVEPLPERPTKSLPTRSLPSKSESEVNKEDQSTTDQTSSIAIKEEPSAPPTSGEIQNKPHSPTLTEAPPAKSHLSNVETSVKPPSSPLVRTKGLPEPDTSSTESDTAHEEQTNQIMTAIYRPESKATWLEQLRSANEKRSGTSRDNNARNNPPVSGDDQLANVSLTTEEPEVKEEAIGLPKSWVSKRMLKSHLDIVRSVAIASGPGILVASGGDDNTVKIWSVDTSSLASSKPVSDIEPIATYRGHTAPVTSVLISSEHKLVFSASLDSSIRIWALPDPSRDPYGPYDPSSSVQTLVGHTEAIWDLCLLRSRESIGAPTSFTDPNPRLASCSADGTVKIWSSRGTKGQWTLAETIKMNHRLPTGVVPTCLGVYRSDYTKVLVGLSSGQIALFDTETNKLLATIGSPEATSQVNCVMLHPTEPVIIAGYEDGYLRTFDYETYAFKTEILAHEEAITSLALSPSTPFSIITSSTNCSIRVWDLSKGISVQDLGGHRTRGGEGVCQVAGHPELGYLASAGADGVVRLWASA